MSRANPRYRRSNQALPAAPANVWELQVIGQLEAQEVMSTFAFWDNGGAITGTPELNLAAGFTASLLTTYKACLSSDWVGQQYNVRCLTIPTRAQVTTTAGIAAVAGSGPAGHEPTTVAAVVSRYTAFRGQCGRGRLELPAVPTSWVTSSSLTTIAAYTAFMTAYAANFIQGGITYSPYLYSRGSRVNHTPGAAPLVILQLRTVLGTQRRRKLGRGV